MPRSPQEVFQHHAEARGAGDLDGIVEDGIDTFIFRDGQIRLQTVRYTLQHTS